MNKLGLATVDLFECHDGETRCRQYICRLHHFIVEVGDQINFALGCIGDPEAHFHKLNIGVIVLMELNCHLETKQATYQVQRLNLTQSKNNNFAQLDLVIAVLFSK